MKHPCDFCGKLFVAWESLIRHHKEKHSGSTYRCLLCKEPFGCKESLENHQCKVPDVRKSVLLNKIQENVMELQPGNGNKHLPDTEEAHQVAIGNNDKNGEEDFEAVQKSTCRKSNINKEEISDGSLKCIRCKECFVSKEQMDIHVCNVVLKKNNKASEEHDIWCLRCKVQIFEKAGFENHLCTVTSAKLVRNQCEVCFKTFRGSSILSRHKREKHDPNFERLSCDQCECTFKRKETLQSHLIKHQPQNNNTLKERISSSNSEGGLREPNSTRLMKVKNKSRNNCTLRKKQCNHCPQMFSQNSSLIRHNREQHDPNYQKIRCEECGSTFSRRSDKFKKHMRAHRVQCVNSSKNTELIETTDPPYLEKIENMRKQNKKRKIFFYNGKEAPLNRGSSTALNRPRKTEEMASTSDSLGNSQDLECPQRNNEEPSVKQRPMDEDTQISNLQFTVTKNETCRDNESLKKKSDPPSTSTDIKIEVNEALFDMVEPVVSFSREELHPFAENKELQQ